MSDIQLEPTAPTIEMWRGRPAPAKADLIGTDPTQERQVQQNNQRIEWERDLEQQLRSRGAKRLPEGVAIDVVGEIDGALTTLETAAQAFERDFGKPNEPLIKAKRLVAELEAKLATAKQELAAIEAKGDSVTRLKTAVQTAESFLLGLHGAATKEVIDSLIAGRLGPGVPASKVPNHLRDEFKLNSRVRGLDALRTIRSVVSSGEISKDSLLKYLDIAGNKLVALRDYVIADREQNAQQ